MMLETLGQKTITGIENLGKFSRFAGGAVGAITKTIFVPRSYSLVLTQMNVIGVQSVPVVMATGAFVGMILAIQAYGQLASMGLEERLGVLINIAVVKELGPVLAAVMLAGRVGGVSDGRIGNHERDRTDRGRKEYGNRPDEISGGSTSISLPPANAFSDYLC